MSKQPLKQLLSRANYKHVEHARKDIENVIKHFRALKPRLERYTYPNGVSKELICLDGTIPVTFREATYNIPIGIFISDNYPIEAPICYVRPTRDMTIKTSRLVDGSGLVDLPYLRQWNKNTSDISSAIQVMQLLFGQACPVYQKVKDQVAPATSVAMPPALPNTPYSYPAMDRNGAGSGSSSGPSSISMPTPPTPVYPYANNQQQPHSINNTGTITEEHIRASLLSAVEDHMRSKRREKVSQIQDEIEVLKRTSQDLDRGKIQLDKMKTRMAEEVAELTKTKEKLKELDDQLQEFIVKYDNEGEEINPDEVYGPSQPLFKQLLEAYAEENAVVDAIYYTSEGLRKGVIELDVFLKSIRELSRRQFMLRALMRACRTRASLPN